MECDSPYMNVFCGTSRRHVFGPLFFAEDSVTGTVYLGMLENWLMPQFTDKEEQEFGYCPTTLACAGLEVPKWTPVGSMDW